jgi:hypothetical protein
MFEDEGEDGGGDQQIREQFEHSTSAAEPKVK